MACTKRVAVIGAGWAGLAAAVELAAAGVATTVFEAARAAGGRARSVKLGGLELDNGQHILLGAYRHTLALLSRINPSWRAALFRLPLALRLEPGFLLRAARLPAPWHMLFGLLNARGLCWSDRLAAARFLAAMRRRGFRLTTDVPVTTLLARHGQTEAAGRLLWKPLCLAALNTPPEEASARIFLHVLRDAFTRARQDSELLLPRAGLSGLFVEPAMGFLRRHGAVVRLSSPVRALRPTNQGWEVFTDHEVASCTHVICALPPWRAAALLAALPKLQDTVARLGSLVYQPIRTLYLSYGPAVHLPLPMVGLVHGPAQWVFDRGALGGPAGLLAVVISARGPHEAMDRHALEEAVFRQLHESLGLPPRPGWAGMIAERRATFSCRPGLARAGMTTPLPGLLLAGDHVAAPVPEDDYPATIEGAVRSGVQCARLILEHS